MREIFFRRLDSLNDFFVKRNCRFVLVEAARFLPSSYKSILRKWADRLPTCTLASIIIYMSNSYLAAAVESTSFQIVARLLIDFVYDRHHRLSHRGADRTNMALAFCVHRNPIQGYRKTKTFPPFKAANLLMRLHQPALVPARLLSPSRPSRRGKRR